MALFDKLKESFLRIRVVPGASPEDSTTFTKQSDSIGEQVKDAIEAGKRIDLSELQNIITLTGSRNEKYDAYEEMVVDGRIGADVEMYSNDTVQYNPEGKVIWVESEKSDIAQYGNKLIKDLNLAENIWSYAYCLWLYGDVYLETFEDTASGKNKYKKPTLLLEPLKQNANVRTQKDIKGARLLRYVEKVPNPAEVYDLQFRGKTAGFVRSKEEINNSIDGSIYTYQGNIEKLDILNPTKFVHICLSPNINRHPEKFTLIQDNNIEKINKDGYIDGSYREGSNNGSLSFTVKTGQSILENVYGAYRTLKLKEDSVLLERITKSSITRVIQLELGDMPEQQKKKKLRELKNQIEQQIILNKESGDIQSRPGAQPVENIIYTTTKNGKGTISTVNIGGDAEIGSMDDIEQSENKVYGALLTPKALLGADMDGSGLSNGGSLTEMNATYARRIKRGQVALCSGIKTLINIFAISEGLYNVVDNFEVKLTPIITIEDNRRDELLQNKVRNVNDMISLFDGIEQIDDDVKLKMLIQWASKYLNQQEIVDIINDFLKSLENEEKEEQQDKHEKQIDGENEDNKTTHFSSNEPPNTPDFNNLENEEPESTENEHNNPPELADQENLADIEGEDLL